MRTPPLPLPIMDTWSIEQKLAVYDLCRLIDRDGLLEAMIRDDLERGFDHTYDLDNCNLELPFEDDLPF
jgi:hypothetical protein